MLGPFRQRHYRANHQILGAVLGLLQGSFGLNVPCLSCLHLCLHNILAGSSLLSVSMVLLILPLLVLLLGGTVLWHLIGEVEPALPLLIRPHLLLEQYRCPYSAGYNDGQHDEDEEQSKILTGGNVVVLHELVFPELAHLDGLLVEASLELQVVADAHAMEAVGFQPLMAQR